MKILFLQERFLILIVNHLKDDNIRELRQKLFLWLRNIFWLNCPDDLWLHFLD